MSKKKDLIKNTLILAFGRMSTKLVVFFLLPLYTFFLTPEEYGTVDLIITYLSLSVPVITLQLEMASFRFLVDARADEAYKKRIISSALQIILAILAVFIAVFAIVSLFITIPYAWLILLCGSLTVFSNLFLQFARGFGDNKKFAIACTVTAAMTLIGTLLFVVYLRMGAEGMFLSMAAANLFCALYLFFSLKVYKYLGINSIDRDLQRELTGYSLPLVPNGISWWVINASDRTIISIILGVAANGIYAVSSKYAAIFTSVFSIFNLSWTESASIHINSKDRDKFFSDVINTTLKLFGSLGLGLIAFVPLIFNFLIDARYDESYVYIPILVLAAFFNVIAGMYSAIYIAKKLTKRVGGTAMMAAAISIALNLIFIYYIGLYAIAISTAAAYFFLAVFRHYDVKKYVKITYDKNLFVILGGLFILTAGLYYLNNPVGNVINALVITIAAIVLNKTSVKAIKDKVMTRHGRKNKSLTPSQRLDEDL